MEDKCNSCEHLFTGKCISEFMYSECLTEGYYPEIHGEGFPYSLYKKAEGTEAIENDLFVCGQREKFDPSIEDYEKKRLS